MILIIPSLEKDHTEHPSIKCVCEIWRDTRTSGIVLDPYILMFYIIGLHRKSMIDFIYIFIM